MELINKTLFYYLLVCVPLMLIAGCLSYYLIYSELKEGQDEALQKEKLHLQKAISKNPELSGLNTNELVKVAVSAETTTGATFSDSVFNDPLEDEAINYRILHSVFTANGRHYSISIASPTMEREELLEGLLSTFAIIGIFLMLSFFVVSWLLSKALWKPFYKTIDTLGAFDVKNNTERFFEASRIYEFSKLNEVLNKMTRKINEDFLLQKEFTENASHEMQTPLAIIKANTSLLMQSPNIKSEEMGQVQAIDDTTQKLASLNRALLLLAKIDNHQFKELASVEISDVAYRMCLHFEDLLTAKEISVENSSGKMVKVFMNAALADMLISNLFQNAIRHNFNGGKIILELNKNTLSICNTGGPLTISDKDLFRRFKKNEASAESLGLGLAIVNSICLLYNIGIDYSYKNKMHCFRLRFDAMMQQK